MQREKNEERDEVEKPRAASLLGAVSGGSWFKPTSSAFITKSG